MTLHMLVLEAIIRDKALGDYLWIRAEDDNETLHPQSNHVDRYRRAQKLSVWTENSGDVLLFERGDLAA